jgi:hypothetical protein
LSQDTVSQAHGLTITTHQFQRQSSRGWELLHTSVEHSCEMPSRNDDVPSRDAEGRTSFNAEKTAQSLYAQLGLHRLWPRHMSFPSNWTRKFQEIKTPVKNLKLRIKSCQLLKYLSGTRTCSGSRREQQLWLDRRTNLPKS